MKEIPKWDKLRIVRRYYFEKIRASTLKKEENISTEDLSAWIHKYLGEVRKEANEAKSKQ